MRFKLFLNYIPVMISISTGEEEGTYRDGNSGLEFCLCPEDKSSVWEYEKDIENLAREIIFRGEIWGCNKSMMKFGVSGYLIEALLKNIYECWKMGKFSIKDKSLVKTLDDLIKISYFNVEQAKQWKHKFDGVDRIISGYKSQLWSKWDDERLRGRLEKYIKKEASADFLVTCLNLVSVFVSDHSYFDFEEFDQVYKDLSEWTRDRLNLFSSKLTKNWFTATTMMGFGLVVKCCNSISEEFWDQMLLELLPKIINTRIFAYTLVPMPKYSHLSDSVIPNNHVQVVSLLNDLLQIKNSDDQNKIITNFMEILGGEISCVRFFYTSEQWKVIIPILVESLNDRDMAIIKNLHYFISAQTAPNNIRIIFELLKTKDLEAKNVYGFLFYASRMLHPLMEEKDLKIVFDEITTFKDKDQHDLMFQMSQISDKFPDLTLEEYRFCYFEVRKIVLEIDDSKDHLIRYTAVSEIKEKLELSRKKEIEKQTEEFFNLVSEGIQHEHKHYSPNQVMQKVKQVFTDYFNSSKSNSS